MAGLAAVPSLQISLVGLKKKIIQTVFENLYFIAFSVSKSGGLGLLITAINKKKG